MNRIEQPPLLFRIDVAEELCWFQENGKLQNRSPAKYFVCLLDENNIINIILMNEDAERRELTVKQLLFNNDFIDHSQPYHYQPKMAELICLENGEYNLDLQLGQ